MVLEKVAEAVAEQELLLLQLGRHLRVLLVELEKICLQLLVHLLAIQDGSLEVAEVVLNLMDQLPLEAKVAEDQEEALQQVLLMLQTVLLIQAVAEVEEKTLEEMGVQVSFLLYPK